MKTEIKVFICVCVWGGCSYQWRRLFLPILSRHYSQFIHCAYADHFSAISSL